MNGNNNNAQGNNKYSTRDKLVIGAAVVNGTSTAVKVGSYVKDHSSAADTASNTADAVDAASSTSDVIGAVVDIVTSCSIM